MKRIVALILLCSMVGPMGLFAAESLEELTAEERREYNRMALSVQTEHTTEYGGFGVPLRGGYTAMYAEGTTSTDWVPYQGYMRISKPEFLTIAGYPDLAAEEARISSQNNAMQIAGWSLFGVGIATMLSSLIVYFATNNLAAWGGVFGAGTAIAVIGVPLISIRIDNDIAISFAVSIADDYNRALLSDF